MGTRTFEEGIREELLDRLAAGESLLSICRDKRMPEARTIQRWANGDDEFADRIREAREVGFLLQSEQLMEEVRTCEDPQRARVISETRRWQLGKLSAVFRDKPIALGVQLNVDAGDTFAAITGVLDQAAAAIASSGHSTGPVVIEGPTGPGDAAGQLADLARSRGTRVGQDQDGG